MKSFIITSLLFSSMAFAHNEDSWGINKKTKTITTTSRLSGVKLINKRKANNRMDNALELSELACIDAGWKFSLVSRKGKKLRKNGWKVTSVVTCER